VSADGVIPERYARRAGRVTEPGRVNHVGSVQCLEGLPIHISVSGDAVIVAGHYLNAKQRETFAALYVKACTIAGEGRTGP